MKKRWWIFWGVIIFLLSRPGGEEPVSALLVGVGIWKLMGRFFDYIEREREIQLDDLADRFARANARRMKREE